MPKNLGTLAAASLTANQLASLARNSSYLYNMARGRRSYGKSRTSVRSAQYLTGPRYRRVPPVTTRPQLKFSTNSNVGNSFAVNNPDNQLLVSIPAGDAPFNRDGRFLRLMNIRGQMVFPGAADDRLVIYIPRDLQDVPLSLTLPGDAVNPTKYKVLFDKYWHPNNNAGNSSVAVNINFGKYGHKIEYDNSGATDIVRGPVYIYQHSSSSSGTSSGNFIMSFVDN